MSNDNEDLKMPECPACGFLVWDYEPGVSSVIREGRMWHPSCAPSSEPTHISETIEDVLERADTPEEIAEDTAGWNTSEPEPDDHYPEYEYTDLDVDIMLAEEHMREVRSKAVKAESDRLLALEGSWTVNGVYFAKQHDADFWRMLTAEKNVDREWRDHEIAARALVPLRWIQKAS
jgi:hypothetical protein